MDGADLDSGIAGRVVASLMAVIVAAYDAEKLFDIPGARVTDPRGAQCGEVLKGVLKPPQCKLFGTECNPEHPVGALMVSSEGACAAYYRYAVYSAAVEAPA